MDLLVGSIALALAAIPVVRMWDIITETGANTVANDYILYIGMIRSILAGTYHWQNFFSDTFVVGSHFLFFPILIRIAIIRLTHWDVYAESYATFGFALLKALIVYRLFTLAGGTSHARWVLLPVLAALTFSASQVDTFVYGDAGMQIQLNQVGFVLGVYGLLRYRDSWTGLSLIALGGILATWSGGAGLPAWPVFLFGFVAFWTRSWKRWLAFGAAASVALWPYVFFRLVEPKPWTGVIAYIPYPHTSLLPIREILNFAYFVVGFGWPFDQDRGLVVPLIIGFAAFCIWIWAFVLAARTPLASWPVELRAGVMVCAYGVFNILLTMSFRGFLQPWYATHYLPVWLGFVGIGWAYYRHYFHLRSRRLWLACLTGLAVGGYAMSNITYADKALLADMRSPATESCLRNTSTAPLTCGQFIFNWGPVMPWFPSYLAAPLERYRLANFAPGETWALQGDFALTNVKASRGDLDHLVWSPSQGPVGTGFQDFRHLNLVLRAGNAVTWLIRVPNAGGSAVFHTDEACGSISYSSSHQCAYSIRVGEPGAPGRVVGDSVIPTGKEWSGGVSARLTAYSGKVVAIQLRATGPAGSWTAFQYPTVQVNLPTSVAVTPSATWHYSPAPTSDDASVAGTTSRRWKLHGLSRRVGSLAVRRHLAYLTYDGTLGIKLGNVRMLTFRARMSGTTVPRGFSFEVLVNHETSYRLKARWFTDPISLDGRTHTYAINVDVSPFHAHDVLTGLRIEPDTDYQAPVGSDFQISDIRFVRSVRLVKSA